MENACPPTPPHSKCKDTQKTKSYVVTSKQNLMQKEKWPHPALHLHLTDCNKLFSLIYDKTVIPCFHIM